MDRILRPVVAGELAARLAPDRPALRRKISNLLGAQADCVKLLGQAQLIQLAHCMRLQIDPNPKWAQLFHRFKNAKRHAHLMQAQPQRQPANACTRDQHFHMIGPLLIS